MNADSIFVVDANVGVKWFVAEELAEEARTLVASGARLLAVDIFAAEITNAYLRKVAAGDIAADDAIRAIDQSIDLVQLAGSPPLIAEAWRIASRYDRSSYDALYVALALAQDCQLVTGDRRLYNSLQHHYPGRLLWLGDVDVRGV